MNITNIIRSIEKLAPLYIACPWDCSGVHVASKNTIITSIAVMLDVTSFSLASAIEEGVQFIIAHHPLSLEKFSCTGKEPYYPQLCTLLKEDIFLYVAHTSLDANIYASAGFLAKELQLSSYAPISPTYTAYMQCFTIYSTNSIFITNAVQKMAIPHTILCITKEYVQIKIAEEHQILFTAWVTESAYTYSVTKLESAPTVFGIGCIGTRDTPLQKKELLTCIQNICGDSPIRLKGTLPETLSRIAYCPGAGSSLIPLLNPDTVDIYITGEIKHNHAIESTIPLLDVGHFSLEEKMMEDFTKRLQVLIPEVDIHYIASTDPFHHTTH